MKFPSEKESLEILKNLRVMLKVVEHSKSVMIIALSIAKDIIESGHNVDVKMLKSAALLHDVGKCKYNKETGNEYMHSYESGRIMRKAGFDEFAEVVESHFGITEHESRCLGFPEPHDMMPKTIEAKILFVADKIRPGRETLDEVVEYSRNTDKLTERYFSMCDGMKERYVETDIKIWKELQNMGWKHD